MSVLIEDFSGGSFKTNALCEEVSPGNKKWYVEGIFCQANVLNKNNRIYSQSVLDEAVKEFKENYIAKNRGVGELKHPQTLAIDSDRICHKILELHKEGSNYFGKALVLDTPQGKILQALLAGGVSTGFSTRGGGDITIRDGISYVDPGYRIIAIDSVFTPSAPDAFVQGLLEGADFVWDSSNVDCQYVESIKKDILKANRTLLESAKEKALKKFLYAVSSVNNSKV